MRGGLQRWKRGVAAQGVRQAIAYAFGGSCDSHLRAPSGVDALTHYGRADEVDRFVVTGVGIARDGLDAGQLARWVDGCDPDTGERRGRDLTSPESDLVLDGTINAPKSFSLVALIDDDLAREFEALQDRLRDRIIALWQRELNARRGAAGRRREPTQRLEVVELRHRRSRALDPHIHRHLWLGVKVLGEDGRWSNVDSRVAMRLHTVVNAEGEIAARTDPEWIAALARHGYTIDSDGEVAELAHLVRPVSRRANQIEVNRAQRVAEWRQQHPGQEPDRDVLQQIDRWAWAHDRPNKPGVVDETAWEEVVRAEVAALDPGALRDRRPRLAQSVAVADLDRDLLAAIAVVDADRRSASCGGRFSRFDVRAGAMRAVAASGVCCSRDVLQEVIDDIEDRAVRLTVDLLHDEPDAPPHIKHLMSEDTARLKLDLAARFDALNEPGVTVPHDDISALAAKVLRARQILDPSQTAAAAAIAGTDRLVTVTGPAGTGKTTMLRVSQRALAGQRRRMIVVAPTKKAASVAGREIGSAASSLHTLLVDHGWRFRDNAAGAEVWSRLRTGDTDPLTGTTYNGPRRHPIGAGDRIVVDEAGMVDLHAANALAQLAADTGAGIAMVGDHLQAMPVGHSGAMAAMSRRSGAVVELSTVHRFRDPEYAALTLRMRQPESRPDAAKIATELSGRGLIRRVEDDHAARQVMVDAYFAHAGQQRRLALVTASNAEAHAINEAIQQRRVDLGQLRPGHVAIGQGEQRLLEGDIVQTRRNDTDAGVENRAVWVIHSIRRTSIRLRAVGDSGDVRDVSRDYAADHLHLAYASTVHGIQGETTHASVVGPGVDAAGFYVGMTRGRTRNDALAIASTDRAAVAEIAETMMRGTPEVTIEDATRAARSELGRAARDLPTAGDGSPRDDARDAPWHDTRHRPLGRVVDLETFARQAEQRITELHDRIESLADHIQRDKATLADIDARVVSHASLPRASDTEEQAADRLVSVRERLRQRILDSRSDRREQARRYAAALDTVNVVEAERSNRAAQEPAGHAAEDARRAAHTAAASSTGASPISDALTAGPDRM